MSMSMLTVLQLIGITAAYFGVTLLLPWFFLHKRLSGFGSAPARFMAYFLIGHFYIINLVYLLQLLHISFRITLILGTLAPFLLAAWKRYRDSLGRQTEEKMWRLLLILGGEMGRKTLLLKLGRSLGHFSASAGKKCREYRKNHGLEILLVSGLLVLLFYMYGTNAVNVYGYCASDIVLHNYWINEMGNGNIFADGVYPFGLHCLLYYLHAVFGFHIYVLLRLFYLVQTVVIHLVLLAFLRSVCKSKYAPYIGIFIYIVSNRFYEYTYIRYHATLPQEFGMAFILPAAYFAFAFLQEKGIALTAADHKADTGHVADIGHVADTGHIADIDHVADTDHVAGTEGEDVTENTGSAGKGRWKKAVDKAKATAGRVFQRLCRRGNLVLFAISVSLTLSVHFYDTIIAGLLCLAIGAGFCFRVFRWRYFKRIVAAGIAGILLAVLPMAAAFVTGTPMQASLNWGLAQWKSGSQTQKPADDGNAGEKKGQMGVKEAVLDRLDYYVSTDMKTAEFMLGSIAALFLLGIFWCIFRRADYGGVLLSFSIYMAAMAVLQASAELGLMQLLEVSRYSVYIGYGIPVVWSFCVDGVTYVLFKWEKARNVCSFAALSGACVLTVMTGTRAPVCVSPYETNEAITCLSNIVRENKEEAFTICSANDERQMLGDYDLGYHYEVIKFLKDMRSFDEDTEITIPTSTVYFFIEKIPLLYRDYINTEKAVKKVSLEGARQPVSEQPGILPYIGDDRYVTMSHMYYWAQKFKELYPNEMETYYETDRFVCYRVKQNGYSLYNFAIDYGFNGEE